MSRNFKLQWESRSVAQVEQEKSVICEVTAIPNECTY